MISIHSAEQIGPDLTLILCPQSEGGQCACENASEAHLTHIYGPQSAGDSRKPAEYVRDCARESLLVAESNARARQPAEKAPSAVAGLVGATAASLGER